MTDSSSVPFDDSQRQTDKSWNQKLEEWFKSSGLKIADVERAGLSSGTFYDYRTGRITDLSRVSEGNRRKLYSLTHLDCFKVEGYEGGDDLAKEAIDSAVVGADDAFVEHITGSKRRTRSESGNKSLESSTDNLSSAIHDLRRAARVLEQAVEASGERIVKVRVYEPTSDERADSVMQLIDLLAESIDHYRTATSDERQVLVDKLKADPSSFGYVTQMINAFYKGENIDSWMMMAQPPSKIRRAMKGEERK